MLVVVSELYYPEDTGTAHYMTSIAEGMARNAPVQAICARRRHGGPWNGLPAFERHHGVEIRRCWSTAFDKNRLVGRACNLITTALSLCFTVLRRVRRGDHVLVVIAGPPILPLLTALACRIRGARCFLRIDDVYPEAMIHARLVRADGVIASLLDWMNGQVYLRMERIVVLGRDMKRLVERKLADVGGKLVVIPNWADVDVVAPADRRDNQLLRELGLLDKFVIGYAGNIGRVQGVEALFDAACRLRETADVHFLFVGSGQKAGWLRQAADDAQLKNMTLIGPRPRAEQAIFLNACDVGIVPLVPGMSGAGVPSRLYNLMAAGKPVIAAVDDDSEPALVVREEAIGWVVPAGRGDQIVTAILEAKSDERRLKEMGRRARKAAEERYSPERIIKAYEDLMRGSERGVLEPNGGGV
jgi:glycosyltransferase involved in cell wall biosynthesis